jgi:hypothetical protein
VVQVMFIGAVVVHVYMGAGFVQWYSGQVYRSSPGYCDRRIVQECNV